MVGTLRFAHPTAPLDNHFGGQRRCSGPQALPCGLVIASEAKQSIAPQKERMDCFVATLLAMTKRARLWTMVLAVKGVAPNPKHYREGSSLRAKRSNPSRHKRKESIASSLRSSQ